MDGTTVSRLIEAVRAGDTSRVGAMLQARPAIVNMDVATTSGDAARRWRRATVGR